MEYITSESQLIDVQTIKSGCDVIASAGRAFDECATEVEAASDMCGIDVFSVDKKSMQPIMLEIAQQIRTIKGIFEEFSSNIQATASQIYSAQYAQLQAYYESLNNKEKPENSEDKE